LRHWLGCRLKSRAEDIRITVHTHGSTVQWKTVDINNRSVVDALTNVNFASGRNAGTLASGNGGGWNASNQLVPFSIKDELDTVDIHRSLANVANLCRVSDFLDTVRVARFQGLAASSVR
jgi:hypothetical protein